LSEVNNTNGARVGIPHQPTACPARVEQRRGIDYKFTMSSAALKKLETAMRDRALAYPETEEAFPWGERAIKVKGKTFLFMRLGDTELSFSVKLPNTGVQALALPFAEPTEYGLGKSGWVTVRLAKVTKALTEQCMLWIDESFRAVAPKRALAALIGAASVKKKTARSKKA
jgi:predicted DNA-binding protein (MmcQ/YjbR family)